MKHLKKNQMTGVWLLVVLGIQLVAGASSASNIFGDFETEWGGHLRLQGSVTKMEDETVFRLAGAGNYYDGFLNFRLKNKIFFKQLDFFTAECYITPRG